MARRVPKKKPKSRREKPSTFLALTAGQAESFVESLKNLREEDKEFFDKSVLGLIYEAMIRRSR